MTRKYRKFDEDFKAGAVQLVEQTRKPIAQVARELGISKSHAYKVIHNLNAELREKGYLTISGRVNRNFFMEKFCYGKTGKEG